MLVLGGRSLIFVADDKTSDERIRVELWQSPSSGRRVGATSGGGFLMTTELRQLKRHRARRGLMAMMALLASAASLAHDGNGRGKEDKDWGWGGGGHKSVEVRVVSSPARYVSGGDARIEVRVPSGLQNKIELYLNGRRLSANLKPVGIKG